MFISSVFEQNLLAEAVRCWTGHEILFPLWDVYSQHSIGSIAVTSQLNVLVVATQSILVSYVVYITALHPCHISGT